MAGDCPVGVLSILVHCDVANFDVCQNRGVAKKGSNPHPLPERMRSAGTNPLPRFLETAWRAQTAVNAHVFFRQLMRMLGCTSALILSASHSQGGAAWAVQGQLVTSVKQGVAQLCETPLDEAAFEKSKTAQGSEGVVVAEGNQRAEVVEVKFWHRSALAQQTRQMAGEVERLLVRHLCRRR